MASEQGDQPMPEAGAVAVACRAMSAGKVAVSALASCLVGIVAAQPAQAHGGFWDDDGNTHERQVEAIHDAGITKGCNPPLDDRYCPGDAVTRGQMAAFIDRALTLPPSSTDHFVDDADSQFQSAIDRLAAAGITRGCNPPDNDRYCPDHPIPRDQMAAFLDRAFVEETARRDAFQDDDGNLFASHIDRVAAAGITRGCNPPDNTRYCPDRLVTRAEMASYLARAMVLSHPDPTPGGHELVITYSWGPEGNPDLGSLAVFATRIHQALHSQAQLSESGWNIDQRIFFQPVATGGDFHLWLTDDENVGNKAAVCSDTWSCTVGNDLYINDQNFARATAAWSHRDLADYQRYVIDHEVGHFLGFEARTHYNDPAYCESGGRAPVMMQQSIDLHGCVANVWPLGWERDCVEEVWLPDTTDQGGVHAGQCPHPTR